MKIMYVQILYLVFIVCNVLFEVYCSGGADILKFQEVVTVAGVSLGEPNDVLWYWKPEDRQKLCFYAAVWAKLPWVDFSYVPYWQKNQPLIPRQDDYYYGMLCKGSPDFYLARRLYKGEIQIRIVHYPLDYYEFDASKMISVQSITLRDDLSKEFGDTAFAKMKPDDRKNLCALALQHTEDRIYFVDGDIGKARPHTFEYEDETSETDIAIACPTSPKLYLCPGESPNRIKLVLFKSGIDVYTFEKDDFEAEEVSQASKEMYNSFEKLDSDDRIKLCTLARQWNGLTTLDTDRDVPVAQVYKFNYSGKKKEERNIAILCPVLPLLYLRLVDKYKIKLTFAQLEPNFHVSGIQVVRSVFQKRGDKILTEDKLMKNHLFTGLDEETRWRMCHMGQKFILQSKDPVNFRFTEAEKVLLPFKLLMNPNSRSMGDPHLYEIRHQDNKKEEEVAYLCTEWPEMYIRPGTSADEIRVILIQNELSRG